MMREFTKYDWYGFGGAEAFPNGSQPLIGTYGPLIVVIDANGLQAWLEDDEEHAFILPSHDVEYCKDIAERILKDLKNHTPREIQNYLDNL